jgi:predicted nucleic acid-binding protein
VARAVGSRPYLERLQHLLEQAEVVVPEETPRVVAEDPDDDKLVAAALAAGAVVVNNDAHLLAVAGHKGLQVQRPADVCDPG